MGTECLSFVGNDTGEVRIASVTAYGAMGAASNCRHNPAGMATGTWFFGATRPTTVGGPATCSFQGMTTMGGSFTCVLSNADGLPVELMDFELEPRAAESE